MYNIYINNTRRCETYGPVRFSTGINYEFFVGERKRVKLVNRHRFVKHSCILIYHVRPRGNVDDYVYNM